MMGFNTPILLLVCVFGSFTVLQVINANPNKNPLQFESIGNRTEMCYLCLVLMEKLEFAIQQNNSLEVINSTLYKICNMTTGELRQECIQSIPWILQQLQSGFNPQTACMKLTLCSCFKAPHSGNIKKMKRRSPDTVGVKSCNGSICAFNKCQLCKTILGVVDEDLYKDEATLLANVDKLCHRLPPPADMTCVNSMNYQIPIWFKDFFQNVVTPDKICALLKLCP